MPILKTIICIHVDSATYRDPGNFLTGPDEINSEVEEEIIEDCVTVDSSSVKSLACALLQIEQAVAHKHLKRPLGNYNNMLMYNTYRLISSY